MERDVRYEDLWGNPCLWLVGMVFLAVFLLAIVWVPVHYRTTHTRNAIHRNALIIRAAAARSHLLREANPGVIPRSDRATTAVRAARSQCKAGETYDAEVEMCAPTFHVPLAFNGPIMDHHYTACDASFYRMMCGTWISEHVNENRAFTYGYFKTQRRLRKLISAATTPPTPLNAFYRSCLNKESPASLRETRIEFVHILTAVMGDFHNHADLPTVWGRLGRLGYTAPFVVSIERHPTERKMIPLITYDGFPAELMEESAIYRVLASARILTQYNTVEEQRRIEGILAVDRALRMHRTASLEECDDYGAYVERVFPHHLLRYGELPHEWYLGTTDGKMRGWNRYFQALSGEGLRFGAEQWVWVPDRGYLEWLLSGRGMADVGILDWKAWIEFSILYNGNQFDPALSSDVYFRHRDHWGPVGRHARFHHHLRKSTSKRDEGVDREASCLRLTQHMLPGLVAERFLQTYMAQRHDDQREVAEMTQHLVQALTHFVNTTRWLDPPSKQAILHKLNGTLIRIMEPSRVWESEPFAPALYEDRYDHNMNMVRRYRVEQNLGLWLRGAPEAWDRAAIAFFATPLTDINAYYSGPTNSITILAGIMQHPFYDRAYNRVSKYAIIGSIIGHELSHSIDHHGLYWDRAGEMRPSGLLSKEMMRRFYDESECVIREYGPAPGGCEAANAAYGNATVGEDMADLVGFRAAYYALFNLTEFGRSATLGDRQHFFMVLSQAFCESYDQEHLCEAVASDVHAVAQFRIDRSVRNIPEFAAVFGCHAGQGMYVAPGTHCVPWGAA